MRSFLPVDVNITVGEDRTTYRRYAHGLFLHAHFLNHLGYKFVYHTMRTTGTIVHRHIVHESRLLINQILLCYDFVFH